MVIYNKETRSPPGLEDPSRQSQPREGPPPAQRGQWLSSLLDHLVIFYRELCILSAIDGHFLKKDIGCQEKRCEASGHSLVPFEQAG